MAKAHLGMQKCLGCLRAPAPKVFSFPVPKGRSIPCRTSTEGFAAHPGHAKENKSSPCTPDWDTEPQNPDKCAVLVLLIILCTSWSGCSHQTTLESVCAAPRAQCWPSPRHQQGFAKAETLPQVLRSPCPAACQCLYVSFLVFRLSAFSCVCLKCLLRQESCW